MQPNTCEDRVYVVYFYPCILICSVSLSTMLLISLRAFTRGSIFKSEKYKMIKHIWQWGAEGACASADCDHIQHHGQQQLLKRARNSTFSNFLSLMVFYWLFLFSFAKVVMSRVSLSLENLNAAINLSSSSSKQGGMVPENHCSPL